MYIKPKENTEMKAFVLKQYNTPGWVELHELAMPELEAGKVRVRIKAFSVNPVDYKIAKGAFILPLPRVIGIDFAGIIEQTGADVFGFVEGQHVFGLANLFTQGTFAEYVDVDQFALSRMPAGLSFAEAAVIPCAGITAWQAVMQKAVIPQGSNVFITSGGGGVGGFAIQFAHLLGANVITTASKNFQRIYGLGASHIINYKTESIKDRIMELTAQEGVHAVIDMVSPESAYENAKLLRYNGAIVSIQGRPEQWPFDPFTKAITMAEVALGAAYVSGDKESLREMAKAGEVIAKLIVEKKVDPMISHEYRFDQLQQALSQVSSRTTEGKVVVLV